MAHGPGYNGWVCARAGETQLNSLYAERNFCDREQDTAQSATYATRQAEEGHTKPAR